MSAPIGLDSAAGPVLDASEEMVRFDVAVHGDGTVRISANVDGHHPKAENTVTDKGFEFYTVLVKLESFEELDTVDRAGRVRIAVDRFVAAWAALDNPQEVQG
ncbi:MULTISPECIES: hypothetical protein [Rhodococcus]|uniref:hypothetical protein n=1 Tax=Rhodococcus TaxID=1827 RepID=UPI000C7B9D04|nr:MULTISPECIES: hypothetical protein [Rhodococcus]AUM16486.1 hypothetical protein CSW53_08080 [Rhodococcus ruber]